DVAVIAPDALVAAGAERLGAGAGEDDHPDLRIVPRRLESAGHLEHGRRPERVAHLGPVDGDLGDAVPGLVDDVGVAAGALPARSGGKRPPAGCALAGGCLTLQAGTPRAITSTIQS